ncbi:MAG: hypothetical protein ACI86C_001503, partial [Candidatus Latescibacterota bacterium]
FPVAKRPRSASAPVSRSKATPNLKRYASRDWKREFNDKVA